MAIITCPECGGKVSDKAAQCIHCGYPLAEMVKPEEPVVKKFEVDKPIYTLLFSSCDNKQKTLTSLNIQKVTDIGAFDASNAIYKSSHIIKSDITRQLAREYAEQLAEYGIATEIVDADGNSLEKTTVSDELRCPRCGSTNVVIGTRGFSVMTGFIGAGQTMNRCGKCGYKWKP